MDKNNNGEVKWEFPRAEGFIELPFSSEMETPSVTNSAVYTNKIPCEELLNSFKDKYKEYDNSEIILSHVQFDENSITNKFYVHGIPNIKMTSDGAYVNSSYDDMRGPIGKLYSSVDEAMDAFLSALDNIIMHPDKWDYKRDYAIDTTVAKMVFTGDYKNRKSYWNTTELYKANGMSKDSSELIARSGEMKECPEGEMDTLFLYQGNDMFIIYEDWSISIWDGRGISGTRSCWVVLKLSASEITEKSVNLTKLIETVKNLWKNYNNNRKIIKYHYTKKSNPVENDFVPKVYHYEMRDDGIIKLNNEGEVCPSNTAKRDSSSHIFNVATNDTLIKASPSSKTSSPNTIYKKNYDGELRGGYETLDILYRQIKRGEHSAFDYYKYEISLIRETFSYFKGSKKCYIRVLEMHCDAGGNGRPESYISDYAYGINPEVNEFKIPKYDDGIDYALFITHNPQIFNISVNLNLKSDWKEGILDINPDKEYEQYHSGLVTNFVKNGEKYHNIRFVVKEKNESLQKSTDSVLDDNSPSKDTRTELITVFKDKYKKYNNSEHILSYVHFEENSITGGLNPGGIPKIIKKGDLFYVESSYKDKGKAYASIDEAMDYFLTLLDSIIMHPDKWIPKHDYIIDSAANDMVFSYSTTNPLYTSPAQFLEKNKIEGVERELLAERRYVRLKETEYIYEHKLYKCSNNEAVYYYEFDTESSRGERCGYPNNKYSLWLVLKIPFDKIMDNDIDIFHLTNAVEHLWNNHYKNRLILEGEGIKAVENIPYDGELALEFVTIATLYKQIEKENDNSFYMQNEISLIKKRGSKTVAPKYLIRVLKMSCDAKSSGKAISCIEDNGYEICSDIQKLEIPKFQDYTGYVEFMDNNQDVFGQKEDLGTKSHSGSLNIDENDNLKEIRSSMVEEIINEDKTYYNIDFNYYEKYGEIGQAILNDELGSYLTDSYYHKKITYQGYYDDRTYTETDYDSMFIQLNAFLDDQPEKSGMFTNAFITELRNSSDIATIVTLIELVRRQLTERKNKRSYKRRYVTKELLIEMGKKIKERKKELGYSKYSESNLNKLNEEVHKVSGLYLMTPDK